MIKRGPETRRIDLTVTLAIVEDHHSKMSYIVPMPGETVINAADLDRDLKLTVLAADARDAFGRVMPAMFWEEYVYIDRSYEITAAYVAMTQWVEIDANAADAEMKDDVMTVPYLGAWKKELVPAAPNHDSIGPIYVGTDGGIRWRVRGAIWKML